MIKNDPKINSIAFGDIVGRVANERNVSISEAREIVSKMSFIEYRSLNEFITPPSGNPIGTTPTQQNTPTSGASKVKSIWPGKGAPVEKGMTVGIKGSGGTPAPGEITQVDAAAKGVKIKNPTTGQEEWANMDTLQPFMAGGKQVSSPQPPPGSQTTLEDNEELVRLRELAGIKENCSAGATGAASIAVAPAAVGSIKRRQPTEEQIKKEYTPDVAKTVVGDTKPNQASGELSANLAARGKKTAKRTNNGFKR